jgi:hypothetical protein
MQLMKLFALYILLSFLGIAVLGFTGLTSHDSLFSRCVEATIPGGLPCDGQDTSASGFMAAVYKGFSSAVVTFVLLSGLVLVVYSRLATIQTRDQIFSIVSKLESKTHSNIIKYNLWSELNQQHPARS